MNQIAQFFSDVDQGQYQAAGLLTRRQVQPRFDCPRGQEDKIECISQAGELLFFKIACRMLDIPSHLIFDHEFERKEFAQLEVDIGGCYV